MPVRAAQNSITEAARRIRSRWTSQEMSRRHDRASEMQDFLYSLVGGRKQLAVAVKSPGRPVPSGPTR